ncbi:MAG TPA: TadE family protein [Acidimicrobiales bacterium]|jgi:hypothetical protein
MTPPTPRRAKHQRHPSRQPKRFRGDEGAITAELTIISPVFFAMMLFLVHIGLWLHAVNMASTAAQEAASIARSKDGSAAAAEARGNDFLRSTSLRLWQTTPTVEVTYIGGNSPADAQEARAEVHGTIQGIIPLIDFHVDEVSQGPVERFRGPGQEQNPG